MNDLAAKAGMTVKGSRRHKNPQKMASMPIMICGGCGGEIDFEVVVINPRKESKGSARTLKIVNKDSAFYGQEGILVNEKKELGSHPYKTVAKFRKMAETSGGYLVLMPNGEEFFFSPNEVKFVN